MTREQLIQTPEYWKTLYENECERLGIEPTHVKFTLIQEKEEINEEELDEITSNEKTDNI